VTLTLEARVEVLEDKVENLETNAGPGRVDAHAGNLADLRRQFTGFGEAQAKHTRTLDIHTGKLNGLERSAIEIRFDVGTLKTGLNRMNDEVTGKLERLDNDVSGLRGDVTWLKGHAEKHEGLIIALSADAAALKDEIAELRTDVNGRLDRLDGDVAGLRTEVTGLRTEVTGLRTEVTDLRTEVTDLRGELSEFKVEVRGTLKEILDRLPAKAA
jgi:chromosome segregation ATPase